MTTARLDSIAARYQAELHARVGRRLRSSRTSVLDNFLYIGLIKRLFPECQDRAYDARCIG